MVEPGPRGYLLRRSAVDVRRPAARDVRLVAVVADAETGEPLEGAEVILLDIHRLGTANQMGEARLDGLPRGPQRVRVRKIGYAPSGITIAVSGDTTGAVFRLPKSVTRLGTINVEADWVPPKIRDMERRRRKGIGRFLSAELLCCWPGRSGTDERVSSRVRLSLCRLAGTRTRA